MEVIKGAELGAMIAEFSAAIQIPMVPISGGTFMMGSNHGLDDERPEHLETVDSFQMSVNLVTNEEYANLIGRLGKNRFVRIGFDPRIKSERVFAIGDVEGEINQLTAEILLGEAANCMAMVAGFTTIDNTFMEALKRAVMNSFVTRMIEYRRPSEESGFGRPRQPVEKDWFQSLAFANLLGLRLATEAEWEYAARVCLGGGLRTYATPNDNPDEAHYYGGCKALSPVDVDNPEYAPLPNGLRHMCGNLREWVRDWFVSYRSTRNKLGEEYLHSLIGPYAAKVCRGGHYSYRNPNELRASHRERGDVELDGAPAWGGGETCAGFRVASSLHVPA